MIQLFCAEFGSQKKVITVPKFLLKLGVLFLHIQSYLLGKEPGLHYMKYLDAQTRNMFFDSSIAQKKLGYKVKSIKDAVRDTVTACGIL
jgi:hypothetical protein